MYAWINENNVYIIGIASIICMLFKQYILGLLLFYLLLFATFLVLRKHHFKDYHNITPKITCRQSTISNPMSNTLPYINSDSSLKACTDDKEKIDNLFNGFLRDQDDNLNEEKSFPFITMPDSSFNGTKMEFTNFLLGDFKPICKSEGNDCETYRDVRFRF